MKLFIQEQINLQILLSSALVFVVCFTCLNLLNQSSSDQDGSQLLPLVLNTAEPFLITGNIDRLRPELEQLISGSSLERIDVHGADSSLLASVRNMNIERPPSGATREFSAAIVLDDALAATVIVQEYQSVAPQSIWPNLLISFACALAAAIASLFLNTLQNLKSTEDWSESSDVAEETSEHAEHSSGPVAALPINTNPKGHQRMILMIRLSDIRDQLIRTDDVEIYMNRVWRITERMAETYGISCIGVQSGLLVFTASASNNAVALRHCIMFGWNLGRQEEARSTNPASLIAPIDFMGENPSYTLALASNEELLRLQERLDQLNAGEFCVCESLQSSLPKSVDAIPIENNNLKILSIETRMLELWKQQVQLQS